MSNMKLKGINLKNWEQGTNILELDVPPQLEATVPTGVGFFDDALSSKEGITPSSSILFTGTPGAGKTTLCLQLADAITKSGHICLFNTGEESLFQVRKVAKRLNLQHGFIAGQDTHVPTLLEHAGALMKANRGKQVFMIVDSLATLDDGFYANGHVNSMSSVRSIEKLTDFCKETFAIAITIGQVNKQGDFAGKQQIKHVVDVHAHLSIDDEKRSETYGERIFEVTKNRYGVAGLRYVLGIDKSGLYEKGVIKQF